MTYNDEAEREAGGEPMEPEIPEMPAGLDEVTELEGKEVAGYYLRDKLGEGGMAVVYRGENSLDPTIVRAIKVVRPELSARPEFVSRFVAEGRILDRLRHENIVEFYGIRRDGKSLIMELALLEGETLDALAKKRPQLCRSMQLVVEWMVQASRGTGMAHAMGVVHRDLKPENLFLTQEDVVKVLDFGIAKALDEADRVSSATRPGTVPGSPAYMAPEVCEGSVPSPRSDVYSLGLCLYELLVGHHPYNPPGEARRSSMQLLAAQMSQPIPPLRQVRPDAPVMLEQVVARAVAKDPNARYADGAEFSDALRGVIPNLPLDAPSAVQGSTASRTRFELPTFGTQGAGTTSTVTAVRTVEEGGGDRRKLYVAGGLAAVAIVAAGLWFAFGRGPDPRVDTARADAVKRVDAALAAAVPEAERLAEELLGPNRWIRVEPPDSRRPVVLGVDPRALGLDPRDDEDQAAISRLAGFLPELKVVAPAIAYEIQQHEVSWEELDPWLVENPQHSFTLPSWTPAVPEQRAKFPATGMPWQVADAYCQSIGGALPTEDQWEYAARGPQLLPYPWGQNPPDPTRTRVTTQGAMPLSPIMTSDQDRTQAADPEQAIYDLVGNAREWTADVWRSSDPSLDAGWATEGGNIYRATRGFLHDPSESRGPMKLPVEAAAYRIPLYASGPNLAAFAAARQHVGFRCVRKAGARP